MRARQWMIACVLSLAGIGYAMAADLDTHDVTTTSRSAADSSARDTGSNNGDLLGYDRSSTSGRQRASTGGNDTGTRGNGAAGGSEHGGRISAPTSAQPETLGWQSLLPGSIQ